MSASVDSANLRSNLGLSPRGDSAAEGVQGNIERMKKESALLQTTVFNLQREIKELEDKKRLLESGSASASPHKKGGLLKKKAKSIKINLADINVEESLSGYESSDFGSARACDIGGWRCSVLIHANEPENLEALSHELEMMENLNYHPNVVRHLFHDIADRKVSR